MRSIDIISIVIVLGLIGSSSQGQLTENSNNTSFAEPKPRCSPLQTDEGMPPSTETNSNTLWLA